MQLVSKNRSFSGWTMRYQHASTSLNCDMIFSIYLPPQAEHQQVPVLYWLSGLSCTDENFMQKAGAQRKAAELGIAIVCPDTSPRGTNLTGEHDSYDLGSGAGFYVNATQAPWSEHYRMYDYVCTELPELINTQFPVNGKNAISGHSMGGHGALICALKNPGNYVSVSAFAPICHPSACPWGQKAFSAYLGEDPDHWSPYDAALLIPHATEQLPLLIDQGSDDEFFTEQLHLDTLQRACATANHPLTLRMQAGYNHSYFFIASFIDDHLQHHGKALGLL
jgi:S-formylglutathione hydrolase